jgi:hypothetical protein
MNSPDREIEYTGETIKVQRRAVAKNPFIFVLG